MKKTAIVSLFKGSIQLSINISHGIFWKKGKNCQVVPRFLNMKSHYLDKNYLTEINIQDAFGNLRYLIAAMKHSCH